MIYLTCMVSLSYSLIIDYSLKNLSEDRYKYEYKYLFSVVACFTAIQDNSCCYTYDSCQKFDRNKNFDTDNRMKSTIVIFVSIG